MRLIRQHREDNPVDECNRLREVDVLDPTTEERLDRAQTDVYIEYGFLSPVQEKYIKMIYAQAMEIKGIYGQHYYVFLHGQSTCWLPLCHFIKALWKLKEPHLDFRQFKALRAPFTTASPNSGREQVCQHFATVRKWLLREASGVQSYRDRPFQSLTLSDHDAKVREDLLSVDAYFFNHFRGESALYFLTNNGNIMQTENIATKILHDFLPNLSEEEASLYAKQVMKTTSQQLFPCGGLFVICVPKDKENVYYRAHPYGLRCTCHAPDDETAILTKLQAGILNASTRCTSKPVIPQYRLATCALRPSTGIRSFLLSPWTRRERKEIKRDIQRIAQHAWQVHGSREIG